MILEYLSALNLKHSIVLASASPRRAQLLKQVGLQNFECIPSKFAEDLDHAAFSEPAGYARETARCKALDVASFLHQAGKPLPDLIIGADTIVDVDGQILEKPGNAAQASEMLKRMSGREHYVHTGLALVVPSRSDSEPDIRSSSCTTSVVFGKLTDAEIEAYIATGEPFDKAGAYGAQGPAALWIEQINGCFYNVMGLPLHSLAVELTRLLEDGRL